MENRSLRILAVDDCADNLTALRAVVADALPDARVFTALNGGQGLEQALAADPDVILLDVVMPDMDGFEVCRRLKEDERLRSIPVVFLTALKRDPESQNKALEAGAEGFLSKPFEASELTVQIRAMAKIKAAHALKRLDKEQLAALVAERTQELERELAERQKAERELQQVNQQLQRSQSEALNLLENLKTEIAERTRAAEALETSERRFRDIADHAQEWIWEVDAQGKYTYSSQVVEGILGYTPDEIRQKHFYDLFHPDDQASLKAAALAAFALKQPFLEFLNRNVHKDGRTVWLTTSGLPLLDEKGSLVGYRGVDTDITERKRLEAQFQQAQKMESVGQLAGGIAHDFNNILAAMMMNLSLLDSDPNLTAAMGESVQELTHEAKRAANLTRQLLLFSRRQIAQRKVLDLNEVLDNLLKMLRRLLGEHIELLPRAGNTPLWIEADPGMMEQVVMNLCVNARDAMPKGGRLVLKTQRADVDEPHAQRHAEARPGGFALLAVEDQGCGMDERTLARIFEPFFTTKDVGKGTGLGLATVYGIVKQHGGWVEVETLLGRGTVFRVYLPLVNKTVASPAAEPGPEQLVGGSETILLVEDEPNVRGATAIFLRHLGYTIWEATNGLEALRLWREHGHRIRLLFTDMVMPEGMTGLDLTEQLRTQQPGLPVIISSGYSVELLGPHGRTAAGITYLPKPCEPAALARKVRECLEP